MSYLRAVLLRSLEHLHALDLSLLFQLRNLHHIIHLCSSWTTLQFESYFTSINIISTVLSFWLETNPLSQTKHSWSKIFANVTQIQYHDSLDLCWWLTWYSWSVLRIELRFRSILALCLSRHVSRSVHRLFGLPRILRMFDMLVYLQLGQRDSRPWHTQLQLSISKSHQDLVKFFKGSLSAVKA